SSLVPTVFDEWNIGDQYFDFRKRSARLARQEREQERAERRKEFARRRTLESIDGIYIPRDLGDCLLELDKRLSEIDKHEMRALAERDDMILYHLGLGMWMRNNWGLWGGSRLQKYFADKGVSHPDEMSSIVLFHYYDWLNGKKDTWIEWEARQRSRVNR
ncbi:MAG TPA: DUF6794 domain-containing protein, partial [Blastocatellia bacterium]|nr:DUF6794 domain-containing protein [Blastocatellia bacterium]